MRLDKYLADMGIGSRKQVKELVRKGHVRVNGETIRSSDFSLDETAEVLLDDQPIVYVSYEYYLINKPSGFICANEDAHSPVVMDLIQSARHDLSCVGRLDKDTTGALLITNDGMLNHRLLSSKNHVEKCYHFVCECPLPENAKELLEAPMDLGDFVTLPAKFRALGPCEGELIIHEGKYHQVKRMLAKIGAPIVKLHRQRFAFMDVNGLEYGGYRSLSEEEIERLKQL